MTMKICILLMFLGLGSTMGEVYTAQGTMIGEVTSTGALLQTRLTAIPGPDLDATGNLPGTEGVVRFEWSHESNFSNSTLTPWQRAKSATDYIVRTSLGGLKPRTRYHYRTHFGANEKTTRASAVGQFITLGTSESQGEVSFIVGSCQNYAFFMNGPNGKGSTATHEDRRLGYPAYAAMLKLKPDFFIGTGDIVYYDHPAKTAAQALPELRRKWHEQARFPRLIEFFSQTPAYWSKDDHDFRFNDADLDGTKLPTPATGIEIFREQMPIHAPGDRTLPTYRTHRINEHLQIWLTEGRDFRSPNRMEDGPDKSLWGTEQREWIKRTLKESRATWKVLISPTPMVGPDDAKKKDNHANLGGFRHEADAFFAWLKAEKISGFMTVCGDRHWQYHSIHPSGFEEFACGALNDENSRMGVKPGSPKGTDPEGAIRQPYTYSQPTGGFIRFHLEPSAKLTIQHHDDTGRVMNTVMKTPTAQ